MSSLNMRRMLDSLLKPSSALMELAGDTVLSSRVRDFVVRRQPQVCVVPAGGARMEAGQDLIMGVEAVIEFTRLAQGRVIANHLEALSHCPVQRNDLAAASTAAGVASRLYIPRDGETLEFLPGSLTEDAGARPALA